MRILGFVISTLLCLSACSTVEKKNSPLSPGTDVHVHIHPNSGDDMQYDGARAVLAIQASNLGRAVVLSHAYNRNNNPACWNSKKKCPYDKAWVRKTNQWTIDESKKNPQLIPFCGIEIGADVLNDDELKFCKDADAKGIKIHIEGLGLRLTDEKVRNRLNDVAKQAGDLSLSILIHAGLRSPEDAKTLIELARSNPKTIFIFAHLLGPNFKQLAENPLPNVYAEISAAILRKSFRDNATEVVSVLRKFGVKRILFGSDWPVFHPSETLWSLNQYPFTAEERELILSKNAEHLFGASLSREGI